MWAQKSLLAGLVLMGIFILGHDPLFAGPVLWPQNKGKLCWKMTDINGEHAEIMKLAVMRTVGNNYVVQGKVTDKEHITLVNGNAVQAGNEILMHLTGSGAMVVGDTVTVFHGLIGQAWFDAQTLVGWGTGADFNCDPGASTPPACKFEAEMPDKKILTPIICPPEQVVDGYNLKK
jgi:hypothetical protein